MISAQVHKFSNKQPLQDSRHQKRKVTQLKLHTEDPQILSVTIQNLVVWTRDSYIILAFAWKK